MSKETQVHHKTVADLGTSKIVSKLLDLAEHDGLFGKFKEKKGD